LRHGELESWMVDERSCETLFMGELTAASSPFCVHSKVTATLVRARYGIDPVWLRMPIYKLWDGEALTTRAKQEARRDLAISPDEIAIATFGIVHSSKGVQECIRALKALRDWHVPAKLYFVGPEIEPLPLELCADLGLTPYIRFVAAGHRGFIEESIYRRYLQAADFGIQLRRFGFGSISGALIDCIAAGVPTVANEELAAVVEAPSYVRCVSNDLNPGDIAKALFELCQERPDKAHLDEERQAYRQAHNFAVYARQLCAALTLDVGQVTGG
jgi:glycosyltransferase involved in cell wall biosynthesis